MFRFYQKVRVKLSILKVDGGYIIGYKHLGTSHNFVHRDDFVFVIYPSLERAKEAAKAISSLRSIPLRHKLKVDT